MKLIRFLLQSSWQMMTIAIGTGLVSGASSAGLIAFVGWLMGQPQVQGPWIMGIAFGGLATIALATNLLSQMMLIRLAQQAILQLRLTLSRQILHSELAHLERLGTPRLLATLTEDVQAIAEAVRLVPFLSIDLATVLGCLAYITWLNREAALLVFGLTSLTIAIYRWILKRAKRQLALARQEQDHLFYQFRGVTEGIKELKLNASRKQAFLQEALQPSAARYRYHSVVGLSWFAVIINFGNFILFFALGLFLFVLPQLFTVPSDILSAYLLTFTYMMLPMQQLISRLPVLSRAGVSLEQVESLNLSLSDRRETVSEPGWQAVTLPWHSLCLKGVTHHYQSDGEEAPFALGAIDLTFHPGELVLIVGGNGSGKSTLAKLITGLYVPDRGEIWFDGQPITAENREWYRQHFSAIFADFYLFDRLLGLEVSTLDQQAQTYLKHLHLHHKVHITQGKFSTLALSQGQRKRLALLTAYLEDRPIYVFDEWAADQDPGFKQMFYTEFLPQLRDRGKTILVISHDDHYFQVADRLIKLDYGQIEYDRRLSA